MFMKNMWPAYQRITNSLLFQTKGRLLLGNRENGFVLVAALIFLVILTVMGMSASSSMQVEMLISKNDRLAKEVFYGADGGLEVGIRMAVENVACAKGFSPNRHVGDVDSTVISGVEIIDPYFSSQDSPVESELDNYPADLDVDGNDYSRDITIPRRNDDGTNEQIHANISVFGVAMTPSGNAIPIVQAYDEGGGSLASTAVIRFDIYSQQFGHDNSESVHAQQWDEKVSTLGECKYNNFKQ